MSSDPNGKQLGSELPKLRNGFRIAGLLLISEIVWAVQRSANPYSREAGGYAAALAVILSFLGTAFLLHCISTYHVIVNQVDGWHHQISPRKAVAFHFIPFYNFYWNFRWPREIARFVNWRTQKRSMSGVLVGAGVLAGALAAALVDASIGFVIIFSVFGYISRCLGEALLTPEVPMEMHVNNRSDYVANMLT